MKHLIKEGNSVNEAIDIALKELGLEEEDVNIEVIDEGSGGLLGLFGKRQAKVKVEVKRDPIKLSREFLDKILDRMAIDAEIDFNKEDDILKIYVHKVDPRDKGILIGKRGNTLDAVQYLLSLHINKDQEDYLKISLDVEGYRAKREETLKKLAQRMADKALRTGRVVKLEPMNPYERRIIHSSLQSNENVTTFSEGSDPYRRIVIQAK